MAPAQFTDLPCSVQEVLAGYISSSDAASCRLAATSLSHVLNPRSESRIWVVARFFRTQWLQDASQARKEGGINSNMTFRSLSRAAQRATSARVLVDGLECCEPGVWTSLFRALMSSKSLQHLTVMEVVSKWDEDQNAALRERKLRNRLCHDLWDQDVWDLTPRPGTEGGQYATEPPSSTSGSRPESSQHIHIADGDSHWLPALVHAANVRAARDGFSQLQQHVIAQDSNSGSVDGGPAASQQHPGTVPLHLTLQLLGPLLPQHALPLLTSTCLTSFKMEHTPRWLQTPLRERNLGVAAVNTIFMKRLNRLPNLCSLSCPLTDDRDHPALRGQILLLDVSHHLTFLELGDAQYSTQARCFAAHVGRLPALKSLTCNLGFHALLETDDDTAEGQAADGQGLQAGEQHPPLAAAVAQSSMQSVRAATAAAMFPSLTRLQLHHYNLADVLWSLMSMTAPCRQLQHLELGDLLRVSQQEQQLGIWQDLFSAALSKLSALTSLVAVIGSQEDLDAIAAAAGSRLQSLALELCLPGWQHDEFSVQLSLQSLASCSAQLTHLKLRGDFTGFWTPLESQGEVAAGLSPPVSSFASLRSFEFLGPINLLLDGRPCLSEGMLPPNLQDLVLWNNDVLPVQLGCFPRGLTRLVCRGFVRQREQHNQQQQPEAWFGWELLPTGLRHAELTLASSDIHGAGPDSIIPVSEMPPSSNDSPSQLAGAGQTGGAGLTQDALVRILVQQPPECKLVPLPCLESLVIHTTTRHTGPQSGAAELSDFINSLSGLVRLTELHVDGSVPLWSLAAGPELKSLTGLCHLKCLHALTLCMTMDKDSSLLTPQELMEDLKEQLRGATRLRLLRLPGVTDEGHKQLARELEDMLPNCLLVDAFGAGDAGVEACSHPSSM